MAEYRGYRGERDDFETDDLRYRRGYGRGDQQQGERFSRDRQGGDMGGGRGYGEDSWSGGQQAGSRDYGHREYGGRGYGSQQNAYERGSPQHGGYSESRAAQSGYGDVDYADRSGSRRFEEDYRSGGYGAGMRGDFGYERGGGYDRGYGASSYDRGYGGDYGGPGSRWSGRSYGESGRGYTGRERDFWDRASDEVSSWFGDEDAERRRRMDQFRGRGPKNYMRSDERIKEDVNDRLSDDGNLDASDIEVDVANGEVTLSGHISNRWDKRRAEDLAEAVSGVKHVQNNLRVRESEVGNAISGGLSATTGATGVSPSRKRQNM